MDEDIELLSEILGDLGADDNRVRDPFFETVSVGDTIDVPVLIGDDTITEIRAVIVHDAGACRRHGHPCVEHRAVFIEDNAYLSGIGVSTEHVEVEFCSRHFTCSYLDIHSCMLDITRWVEGELLWNAQRASDRKPKNFMRGRTRADQEALVEACACPDTSGMIFTTSDTLLLRNRAVQKHPEPL